MRWFGLGLIAVLAACNGDDTFFDDDDGDGFEEGVDDCNDEDAAIHHGAEEVCDGVDNDCDGAVDGSNATDGVAYYADVDGDGFGGTFTLQACDAPVGYVAVGGDCDDENESVKPDADEVCDGEDNDCDGGTDDDDPEGASNELIWYLDADADGFGVDTETLMACDAPAYYAALDGDCDDEEFRANPGELEACDDEGIDEDCDGLANDLDDAAEGMWTWYLDLDHDGFGDDDSESMACEVPTENATLVNGDCDDLDPEINPDAAEACDGDQVDEDCNGVADDEDAGVTGRTQWYVDNDGDTYGGEAGSLACVPEEAQVSNSLDCNDDDAAINPEASEVCDLDNVDEDCDGKADDSDVSATGKLQWYFDGDGDGYGQNPVGDPACDALPNQASVDGDCNDNNASAHPGGLEVCDPQNVDEDCDGQADDLDVGVTGKSNWYEDEDADGFGSGAARSACDALSGEVATNGDCEAQTSWSYPGAPEVCDGQQNDCDQVGWAASDELNVVSVQYVDVGGTLREDPEDWPVIGTTGPEVVELEAETYHVCAGPDAFVVGLIGGAETFVEGRSVDIYDRPVFSFDQGSNVVVPLGSDTYLSGVRLEGGEAVNGGGILVEGNAEVSDTEIVQTAASQSGGGIAVLGGSLTLEGSTIQNTSALTSGGAIYADLSIIAVHQVTLEDTSADKGAGIAVQAGTLFCSDLLFDATVATTWGGALALQNSSAMCTGTFTAVSDAPVGSAIYVDGNSLFQGDVDFSGATGSASVYVGTHPAGMDFVFSTGSLDCDGSGPACNF